MSIEFRCLRCGKMLRTPDASGGQAAKCPSCGALTTVPETPAGRPESSAGSSASDDAFYRCSSSAADIRPTKIRPVDVVGQTWTAFTKTWSLSVGVFALFLVALGVMATIPIVIVGVNSPNSLEVLVPTIVLAAVVVMIYATWLNVGMMVFFIKAARGREARIGDLFAGGPYLWRVIGATILYNLGVLGIVGVCVAPCVLLGIVIDPTAAVIGLFLGLMISVVPTVIFFLTFYPYQYLIIDQNLGIIESFSVSRRITAGNRLTLLLVLLIVNLAGSAIMGATFYLGIFVVTPFTFLLHAIVYLLMIGQQTAAAPSPDDAT